jgi:hypothetical protein
MNRCSGIQRWNLASRRLSASPEARVDNRHGVGRRYLRPRPINPITGWESSGAGLYFLGIKSPVDPATPPRYWRA